MRWPHGAGALAVVAALGAGIPSPDLLGTVASGADVLTVSSAPVEASSAPRVAGRPRGTDGPGIRVPRPAPGPGGSERVALVGGEGPAGEREEVRRAGAVPRQGSARLQLARAQRAKQALAGTRGRERMDRRWEAACAYIAVRVHFPGQPCPGAEGAFRAGELLRGGGDLDVALREFRVARGLCSGGPYHARAMLEIAHLQRRLGRAREALDAYAELYAGGPAPLRLRDESMLWAGRVHHAQGQAQEAWRLWERVARAAEDPVQRVRAYDLLALALIERRDLEGAAGILERCRRALFDVAQEETQTGERVRGALHHMRAVGSLRRSVAQRRGTVRLDGGSAK